MCTELKLQINPLDEIPRLEGAGGQQLKYLGFVQVDITIPELLNPYSKITALLLVVPDTAFKRVPIHLGTNVIGSFWKDYDSVYSNVKLLHVAWQMAGRCWQQLQHIQSTTSSLGEVVSSRSGTIPAGNKTVVKGKTRAGAALCQQISVCLDESSVTSLFPSY